jgi:hypothetical protein
MSITTERRRRRSNVNIETALNNLIASQYTNGLAWKLDAADTGVLDLTGNGRVGTLGGVPAFISPGIVGTVPAMNADGVNDNCAIAYPGVGLWMDTQNFTESVFIKPADLAAEREIMGRPQTYQLWIEVTGKLQVFISPPWSSFLSVGTLIAGVAYLIHVRKDSVSGKVSLWINGVKDSETAHGDVDVTGFQLVCGYSSTGPRYFKGIMSYYAWTNIALSDAQILAHAQTAGFA